VPVAGEVAGAAAEVLVPGPEPVTVEAGLVLGPEAGEVADPVAAETVPLAAAVADLPACVSVEVTDVVPEPVPGTVAAWACRENASKTTRIPTAAIATCTARRATCRKIGSGMSGSRTTGQTRPGS
jgi:hypothetical protein